MHGSYRAEIATEMKGNIQKPISDDYNDNTKKKSAKAQIPRQRSPKINGVGQFRSISIRYIRTSHIEKEILCLERAIDATGAT